MGIAFIIFFVLLCGVLFSRWKLLRPSGIHPFLPASLFVAKILAGLLLILIYSKYYDLNRKADIYRYYDDGLRLKEATEGNLPLLFDFILSYDKSIPEHAAISRGMTNWDRSNAFGFPVDERTVIRVNALLALVTGGNYFAHALVFAFISLLGFMMLFHAFRDLFPGKESLFLLLITLFPGIVFWSSGILKESILFFGIGLLLLSWRRLTEGRSFIWITGLLAAVYIMLFIKIYVLFIIAPFLLVLTFTRSLKLKSAWFFLAALVLITAVFFKSEQLIGKDLPAIIVRKQKDAINEAFLVKAGSYVPVMILKDHPYSFARKTPEAIQNALFRPFPWEPGSLVEVFAALESFTIICFFILLIFFAKKPDPDQWPWIFFLSLSAFSIFILAGMVAPVLGTLNRYRIPGLTFLFMAMLLLIDFEKLKSKWKTLVQKLPS